jgi:hypothetical protein
MFGNSKRHCVLRATHARLTAESQHSAAKKKDACRQASPHHGSMVGATIFDPHHARCWELVVARTKRSPNAKL